MNINNVSKLKGVSPKSAPLSKPKILIYGKPGVGKTWASLDFPDVYYIDTEAGANLSHYTDKLEKSRGLYFGIEQGSLSFENILNEIQVLATEDHPYKTVVIDSITKVFNLEVTKEAERLATVGKKNEYGLDKKPAVAFMKRLLPWLQRIDMNVILIAHEKPEWHKDEQIGFTFDAWEKLEYELHLALHIIKAGGKRIAKVRKTRLKQFPESDAFAWSYQDFAECYGKDVIEKTSIKLVLATPEQLAELKGLLALTKIPAALQDKWLAAANVSSYEEMDSSKIQKIIDQIQNKYILKTN